MFIHIISLQRGENRVLTYDDRPFRDRELFFLKYIFSVHIDIVMYLPAYMYLRLEYRKTIICVTIRYISHTPTLSNE